jgi:hypothetical protein
VQLFVVQRQRQHPGVEPAFAQLAQDDFGLFFHQQQLQAWKLRAQAGNHVRQQVGPERRKHPEAHCAGLGIAAATRALLHLLHFGSTTRRARSAMSRPTGVSITRRGARSTSATPSSSSSFSDLGGQRGLADEAGFRGATEMTQVGQRHEVAQVAQVHRGSGRERRRGAARGCAAADQVIEGGQRRGGATAHRHHDLLVRLPWWRRRRRTRPARWYGRDHRSRSRRAGSVRSMPFSHSVFGSRPICTNTPSSAI